MYLVGQLSFYQENIWYSLDRITFDIYVGVTLNFSEVNICFV